MTATVDFCGEIYVVKNDGELIIGREGDLVIDDNPYLHRRFLAISQAAGLWRIANLGGQLSATVADDQGLMQAWLSPGAQLPLVFRRTLVWFSAGPTTYEFSIDIDPAPFAAIVADAEGDGATTIGRTSFTPDQRLMVLALAEPVLRDGERLAARVPSNAEAAARLGWTQTKFNRKLDNVCQKLSAVGVRGLHGDSTKLASTRRARLVEYVLAARLVTRGDLELLDRLTVSSGG